MCSKLPFRTLVCLWLSVWTAVAPAIPPADLAAVAKAKQELGGTGWRAAIEIDNRRPGRPYPQETCALAFEFMDALWFYCPVDGTRPLSRFQHRVAEDRAAMMSLLQRIEPGFTAWREVPADDLAGAPPAEKPLPNGCFVESLGEARRREASGQLGEAQLLSYYVGAGPQRHGHTVLCVKKDRDVEVYDPADQHSTRVQADFGETNAMDLLQRLLPAELAGRIVKAVTIALLNEAVSPRQA